MHFIQPVFYPRLQQDKFNSTVAGDPKQINACNEKDAVDQTRNQYPFPKPVLYNKPMRMGIRLYGYNDFFKHGSDWSKQPLMISRSGIKI